MRWRPRRRHFGPAQRAGFTLIELMLVLATAGAMVVLAAPRVATSRYHADEAAQLIRVTLRAAQRTALTRQHDVLVSFDTTNQKVRVVWDSDGNGAPSTGEHATWTTLQSGSRFSAPSQALSGPASLPVTGQGLRSLDGMPTLTLHRDGSASGDAEVYLSLDPSTATSFRAIRVTRATGRTDWYREASTGQWSVAAR